MLHLKMSWAPCLGHVMHKHDPCNKGVLQCRVPVRTYSMHGGAGALISVGLLRQVPYERMHKCIQEAYSSGGDGFITECLWEVRCACSPDL